MADVKEIDTAIGAHGAWKARLRQAIDTGATEIPVDTIKLDNQCAFGKWLYGTTLSGSDKASEHYRKVKDLHAQFHAAAAKVARFALAGDKAAAEAMIGLGGEYAAVSAKLTAAMIAWKSSVGSRD